MYRIRQWFRGSAVLALTAGVAAGCGISTQQEVEMGRQYAAEINQQLPIVSDAQAHNYINQVGRSIARFGGRGIDYNFFIVNAEMVNAFAVPGGYVYVNRGLIEQSRNLAELAGVLAHEIGHVEQRHGVEQMEKMQGANLGLTLAYVLLGRAPSGLEEAAINVGGSLYFASHSREAENEADAGAIPLMIQAGIHPIGIVTMFEQLMAEQQRSPAAFEQWFSTHPTTADRVAATRALIERYPASQLRNLTRDNQAFQSFKSRLRQLPRPPAEYRVSR